MYARVVTNQLQVGKTEEWLTIIRESIVPSLEEQAGFRGFVALFDRQHDRSIGYSMWDSRDEMAASDASGNYQQQIAKLRGVLAAPPERGTYEILSWPQ